MYFSKYPNNRIKEIKEENNKLNINIKEMKIEIDKLNRIIKEI